ncbi:conserved hypothetical protein [Mesorhizobium plurifarium]|uniref:Uncharacterized protein n=1 Tax=Mesorhizobium plurifarium TaxID=69974 RepID=A0A090DPI3_MESPL|nr:conserved hypothetical protein [Mesorhizobium plurifarium]
MARPLRLALDAADAADALRGVLGDGRADFVFLPVNNATVARRPPTGRSWFGDLRRRQPLAYH